MTISYRLAVYEPDGALRGYLTDHTSWDASFPFNDVGGLTVSVPQAYAALAAVPCEIAVEAAFESQPSAPFEETTSGRFVVEQSEVERTAGDAAIVKLTGRGYGALMDGAVVIPARYGSAANYDEDGKRRFLSATPGQILRTVLAEARSLVDGLRPGLTLAFTDAKDTLGVAWSKRMTISYEPGTSLLTVLDNMAAQGMVDWAMVGRSLFVWNPDSRAVESGRRIDIGLTEAPARASAAGLIHTAFLVGEKATWREDNTAGTPTPWGRSMTVLNQGGVTVEATARQLAGAALRAGSRIRYEYTCQWRVDEPGMPLPMVSFEPGDWVEARNAAGEWEAMRVHAVTVSDSGGVQKAALTLNDRFVDAEVRNAKRMKGIVNGASGDAGTGSAPKGSSDAKPQAPTGLVGQSWGYWADESGFETNTPRAAVQLDWAPVTLDVNNLPVALSGYEVDVAGKRATVDASGHEATLEDFACGHTVTCRVRAVSRGGRASDWASILVATDYPGLTLDPPTAADMSQSNGIVTIGWDGLLRPGLGAEDYEPPARFDHVRAEARTIVPGQQGTSSWEDAGTLSGPGVLVLDRSDLSDGATVTVRLYAVDRIGGESDPSVEASVELDFPIRREVHAAQDTADDAVAELRSDKAELDGKLAQARSDLSGLSTAQSALAGRVSDAETGLASASARLSTAETNIAAAQASADDVAANLATEHAATATALAGIRTDLSGLDADLTQAQADIVTAQAAADAVASDLASEAASTATALSGIRSDLSGLDSRQENLAGDLSTAQTQLADARTRLATAETGLTQAQADIVTAQTAANTVAADLATEHSATATALAGIRSDLSDLDSRQENLAGDLSTAETSLADARTRLSAAETGLVASDARITAAEADIVQTATDLADAQTDLEKAGQDIRDLFTMVDGGQNWARNTYDMDGWVAQNSRISFSTDSSGCEIASWDSTATAALLQSAPRVPYKDLKGKTVTVSVWIRCGQTTPTYFRAGVMIGANDQAAYAATKSLNMVSQFRAGEWVRASATATLTGAQFDTYGDDARIWFYVNTNSSNTVPFSIKLPKVEIGETMTAWSPHPLDQSDSFAAIAQQLADAEQAIDRNRVELATLNSTTLPAVNASVAQAAAAAAAADARAQTAQQAAAAAAARAFGQRNMVWNSRWDNSLAHWDTNGTAAQSEVVTDAQGRSWLHCTSLGTSDAQGRIQRTWRAGGQAGKNKVQAEPGESYTLQALVYGTGTVRLGIGFAAQSGAGTTSSSTDIACGATPRIVSYTRTCPANKAGFYVWVGAAGGEAGEEVWITDVMLSKGTEPVDWTPAPEDADEATAALDAAIAANTQAITTAQGALAQAQADIAANAGAISTASGLLTDARTRLATAEGTLAQAETDLAANTRAISANTSSIQSAQTSLTDARTRLATAESDLAAAQSDIAANTSAITGVASDLSDASSALSARIEANAGAISTASGLLTDARTRLSTAEGALAQAETDLAANTQAISGVASDLTDAASALSARIAAMGGDVQTALTGGVSIDRLFVGQGAVFADAVVENLAANDLFASTVLAQTLVVEPSEYAPDPALAPSAWTLNTRASIVDGVFVLSDNTTSYSQALGPWRSVKPGTKIAWSCEVRKSDENVEGRFSIAMRRSNGTTTSDANVVDGRGSDYSTEWTAYSGVYTMPSGTSDRLRVMIIRRTSSPATEGWYEVRNVTVKPQVGTVLIQDGAIGADKVNAQSVAGAVGSFLTLNANQITAGTIDTARLNAQQVAGAVGSFLQLNAEQVTAGTIDTARLNAQQVAGAVGSFLTLNANQITAGTLAAGRIGAGAIDASKLNVDSVAASLATIIELNADRITSGTIAAERLNAQQVAGAVGSFLTLNASQITAGTLSADRLDAQTLYAKVASLIELSADKIVSGTIGTARLDASEIAAAVATIIELNADRITSGTINANRLNASQVYAKIANLIEVDAGKVRAGELSAEVTYTGTLNATQINAGTLDVGRLDAADVAAAVGSFLTLNANQLTAGTISADRIGAGAIDAGKLNAASVAASLATIIELDADRITSGTIATGRLNASEVAAAVGSFLTLNASQITAGQIAADRIDVAGLLQTQAMRAITVDAANITGGTIDAAHLNAQAVYAKIANLIEITADKIVSGTISTDRLNVPGIVAAADITAKNVEASKVLATQGGFTQAVIETLVADQLFSDTILARMIAVEPSEYAPDPAVAASWWRPTRAEIADGVFSLSDASTTWSRVWTPLQKVEPGATLAWTLQVRKTGEGVRGAFGLSMNTDDGTTNGLDDWQFSRAASTWSTEWETVSGVWTVPDGVDAVRVSIVKRGSAPGTSDGAYEVRGLTVRPQVGTVLIKDGAITGDKIVAGTVKAANIDVADLLQAREMQTFRITADRIDVTPLDPADPDSGKLTAAQIDVAGVVAAADITAKNVEASRVLATQGGFTDAVIGTLVADTGFVQRLMASQVLVAPTELAPDPALAPDWWALSRTTIVDGVFVLSDNTTSYSRALGQWRDMKPGTTLAWSIDVRKSDAGVAGKLSLGLVADDGTTAGTTYRWLKDSAASTYPAGEWTTYSGTYTVPEDCPYKRFRINVTRRTTSTASEGHYEVRNVTVRPQVGTVLIEDGAITSDKIVVDSVLANDIIAAGTITASKIVADQAGFSQALVDQLAANSVFATNALAQSLVIEPREYAPSPAVLPDWWDATRAAIEDGVFVLSDAQTTWGRVRGGWLKVRPGQRLAWSLEVRKTSASVAGAFAIGYRKPAPDREHEADGDFFWLSEPASEFKTSWQARTGVFTVPDGVDELRVMVVKRGGAPGTSDGAYEVRNLSVRPQVGTVLIEDGSITGDKIVVDSVLANDIIAAGTITASKITVAPTDPADPDSGKLKAAQIDVTGVISVADLSAKTINASQIVGDTAALNAAFIRQLTGDQAFIDQILTQQISVAPSDYAPSPADRPDWWTLAGNATIETDTAIPGGRRFRLRETSPTAVEVKGRMRPINAKTEVYVSFWARCSSTMPAGTLTLQYTYRQPGGSTSTVTAYSVPKSGDDAISSTSWRKYEATITVPATASALSIGLRRTSIAASVISDATWYDVHGLTALAKTGSVLIANGAVTADKITVNAALVDKLTAESLWTGKITTSMLSATDDQKNGLTGVTVSAAGVLATGSAGRVRLSSKGLEAYNAKTDGTRTFWLNASNGTVEMTGTLKSGSTITGATITGSLVRSGTGTTRVEMSGNDITFFQNSKRRLALTASDTSSHGGTGGWTHGGLYVYNQEGAYAGRVRGQIEAGTKKAIFAMDGPGSSSIWLQNGSGKIAWSNAMGLFAQPSYMWLKRNANQYLYLADNNVALKAGGNKSLQFGSNWGQLSVDTNKALYLGPSYGLLKFASNKELYFGSNGNAHITFGSNAGIYVSSAIMIIQFGNKSINLSSSDITLLNGNRGFRLKSNGTTENVTYM